MKKIWSKIDSYFKGVYTELKKISWPKKADVVNHTLIVVTSIVIAVLFVAAIDFGLSRAIEYYISIS